MEVVYRRCCGLDVHKDAVTALMATRPWRKAARARLRFFVAPSSTVLGTAGAAVDWLCCAAAAEERACGEYRYGVVTKRQFASPA